MTRSIHSREILARALRELDDVELRHFRRHAAERMTLSRFETHWVRTLQMARLLLRGRAVDPTQAGSLQTYALVFPLEQLFERSLRHLVPASLQGSKLEVTHRTEAVYMLEQEESREPVVRLRPDFVFRLEGRAVALADAKWKRLMPDAAAHGANPADLYQANAYLTRYGLNSVMLFFPTTGWMKPGAPATVSQAPPETFTLLASGSKGWYRGTRRFETGRLRCFASISIASFQFALRKSPFPSSALSFNGSSFLGVHEIDHHAPLQPPLL